MGENEKKYLNEAFDSNWIAPLGPHVDAFENEMSDYLNVNHSAALSSGTAALHLAMRLHSIGAGDNVLCSSFTFAASANVILYEKANPIFIDSNPNTWTIDLDALEIAMKIYKPKALISVDLYGQSCDYDDIIYLCNKYNVILIEDAAEALGSEYKNKKCGVFGSLGILSFNGNKIITTSGGGMLVSNNGTLIRKAKFLSTQAREPVLHYQHKELGYNYRMSNILASIGRGQLEVLDQRVESKRKIFNFYYDKLSKIDGINFMPEVSNCKSNRWLTTLTINSNILSVNPIDIIEALERENIESRPLWKPMHMQPLYKKCTYITSEKNIDISKKMFESGICLPSGACLREEDQNNIIDIVINTINSQ